MLVDASYLMPVTGCRLPVVNPSQQRYDYFYSHANILQEK
jgi:hypothetical protein